jgi:hypothetical protein
VVEQVKPDIGLILDSVFLDHPEGQMARDFIDKFGSLCEQVDDIIDKGIGDAEVIVQTHYDMLLLLSGPFYQKYSNTLLTVFNTCINVWLDSVKMERSTELWQREQADVLRSIGIEMTLTVIQILGGYKKRRELSIAVREWSYHKHHDEFGNGH